MMSNQQQLIESEYDRFKFLKLVVGAKRGAGPGEMQWLSEKETQLRQMEGEIDGE